MLSCGPLLEKMSSGLQEDCVAWRPSEVRSTIRNFSKASNECFAELVKLESEYSHLYFHDNVARPYLCSLMGPVVKQVSRILTSLKKAESDCRVALGHVQEKTHMPTSDFNGKQSPKYSEVYSMDCVTEMKWLKGCSPGMFWLGYHNQGNFVRDLNSKLACATLEKLKQTPTIGDVLVAYNMRYFRCCVVFVDAPQVGVVDIDQGEVLNVCLDDLWLCKDVIMNMPRQAVCCRLRNIPRFHTYWHKVVSRLFVGGIENQKLYVNVDEVGNDIPPTLSIELTVFRQDKNDFVNVNNWLKKRVAPLLNSCKEGSELNLDELSLKVYVKNVELEDLGNQHGDKTLKGEDMGKHVDVPSCGSSGEMNLRREIGDTISTVFISGVLPLSFYVQQMETREFKLFYAYLQNDFMKQRPALVSDPQVGMHVVVSETCIFRACIVCSATRSAEWNVIDIDTGLLWDVHEKHMFKMDTRCYMLEAQAMECCLSGLPDVRTMPSAVLTAFKSLMSGSALKIIINKILDINPVKYQVTVMKIKEGLEVNINLQMRKLINKCKTCQVK